MPGTIQDPRMNQEVEKVYGVIKTQDGYYAYHKENQRNPKRFMPWGFRFHQQNFQTVSLGSHNFTWIDEYNTPHEIEERCVIPPGWVQQALGQQGPVMKMLYGFIEFAMSNNMWPVESDLPEDSEVIDTEESYK